MNFIRRLSTVLKNDKIRFNDLLLNYQLRENSKNLINTLKGNYKITDGINNEKKIFNNLKKIEMHESHSCKPFIRKV